VPANGGRQQVAMLAAVLLAIVLLAVFLIGR
jgi:hypothetical protein